MKAKTILSLSILAAGLSSIEINAMDNTQENKTTKTEQKRDSKVEAQIPFLYFPEYDRKSEAQIPFLPIGKDKK